MKSAKEKMIEKVDNELKELEGDYRHKMGFACNLTEADFANKAHGKGFRTARNGWPDFLVDMGGKFVAVEVKSPLDKIRSNQRRMFSMLERAGVSVFIWSPRAPDVLTPWKNFTPPRLSKKRDKKAREGSVSQWKRVHDWERNSGKRG